MLVGEKLARPEQKLELREPSEIQYGAAPPNTIACELDIIQEGDIFLTDLLGTTCTTEIAEQPKHVTSLLMN